MKTALLTLILVLTTLTAYSAHNIPGAQDGRIFRLGEFAEGCSTLVFEEGAVLREMPESNSQPVIRLKMGDRVKVFSKGKIVGRNGYEEWTYLAECESGGKTYSGYIWGGDLAKDAICEDIDGDGKQEMFLLGMRSLAGSSDYSKLAEVRALKNGRLVSAMQMKSTEIPQLPTYNYSLAFDAMLWQDKRSFSPEVYVFSVKFDPETANEPFGEAFIAWDGHSLIWVCRAQGIVYGEGAKPGESVKYDLIMMYGRDEALIKYGQYNLLRVIYTTTAKDKSQTVWCQDYKWTQGQFTKTEEYPMDNYNKE